MSEISSFLTPVVNMDAGGNGSAGSNSLTSILTGMNYVTNDTIASSITNIEAIKTKLNETIKVDDGHGTVLGNMERRLNDLETIKTDIAKLEGDIKRLNVYINPDWLVGAIRDKMDVALGATALVGP